MGQYHKLVNLDKKEFVDPHGLGLGAKQYEHTGAFEGSLSDAMYVLTMSSPASGGGDFPMTDVSGRWCGDRVVILGDYTDRIPGIDYGSEIYAFLGAEGGGYVDITPQIRTAFETIFNVSYTSRTMGVGEHSWESWEMAIS